LVEQLRARGHDVQLVSLPGRTYAKHLGDNFSPAWRRTLRTLEVDLLLEDELNHPSLAFAPRPALRPRDQERHAAHLNQPEDATPPDAGAQTVAEPDGDVQPDHDTPRPAHPPIVTIVHHLRSSEEHPAALRPLYRMIEAHYLQRADGFIFNSETTRATVATLRPNLPPHIVAYPAGDHVQSATSLSLREDRASTGEPLRVAFVGNLVPRKGLHLIIEALALVDAPITLEVAGNENADPQYATQVRAQVETAGLGSRVHFLGALSDEARAELYARSHLFALPSYEGFGIVYMEAMAYGLPVIASTAGAAHEIVKAGDNGFLVAPNDGATLARYLTALARDPALLAQMSASAAATFAAFPTWAESTTRSAKFLEELVAS
jgi:glycosyltransferase involved in cell wall biosynthesis